MTTTDDRPEVTCPSWCAECQRPGDDGTRVHFTSVVSLPGDDPEDIPTLDDLSRVWALAENHDAPSYCVHISRAGMTAAEVRETARQLLAFVDRIDRTAIEASRRPATRSMSTSSSRSRLSSRRARRGAGCQPATTTRARTASPTTSSSSASTSPSRARSRTSARPSTTATAPSRSTSRRSTSTSATTATRSTSYAPSRPS